MKRLMNDSNFLDKNDDVITIKVLLICVITLKGRSEVISSFNFLLVINRKSSSHTLCAFEKFQGKSLSTMASHFNNPREYVGLKTLF